MDATGLSIRPVTPGDAEVWRRLRARLWPGEDHSGEIARYFDGHLDEPLEVLLATDPAGDAVGHVELSIREDVAGLAGVRTGYVEGLYVEPGHRAMGIARRLLRASERWARDRGCGAFASDRDDRVVIHRRYGG